MTARNPEHVETILGDLPQLQQIALRPWQQNPLLATVLAMAQSLNEVATWAAQAHQLAQQPPPEVASEATPEAPAAEGEPLPMRAKRAGG